MNRFWSLPLVILMIVVLIGCEQRSARREMPQPTLAENMIDTQSSSVIEDVAQSAQSTPPTALNTTTSDAASYDITTTTDIAQQSTLLSDTTLASTSLPSSQEIQQALQNLGLYQGKIDGKIGPKTKQAIRDFQARNDLKVDGKVGPKTWAKLSSRLQAPAPVAPTTTDSGSSD